ncbi:hypothetical protein EON67_05510 [archaeon]|nr:MAG: hypothetical protein EON67_05510 [archaeon]
MYNADGHAALAHPRTLHEVVLVIDSLACSEFDEARRAIAEAERAEHVAKLERASEFRRVLTEQVDEKQERDARLKADEARTRDLLAARARVEVEELKAVRQRAVEKHGEYRNMLMKQIEYVRRANGSLTPHA